ncbi:MAG TPA: hypothetical protein PL103_08185, partial [Saccharofermentans sp.]|nr:hypothetical protein [Saccharofermentans sp.]
MFGYISVLLKTGILFLKVKKVFGTRKTMVIGKLCVNKRKGDDKVVGYVLFTQTNRRIARSRFT